MTNNFKRISKLLLDYIGISIGCMIMAVAFNSFFVPARIAPGGFSGLAAVLYQFTNFPIGITTLILTIPLFIISIKLLGAKFGAKSFYGTIFFSLCIDFIVKSPQLTDDLFLSSVFGGILLGIGIGIIFRFGGTTGGTDLLAAIMYHYVKRIPISTWLLIIDCIVVVIAGIAFQDIEIALYSILTIYINMRLMDVIQEGVSYSKAFYIISNKPAEITQMIMKDLDRGVTTLRGKGGYTNEDKDVLLCIVNRAEVFQLKDIVRSIDPNAFVILADVHEVIGEGFKNIDQK